MDSLETDSAPVPLHESLVPAKSKSWGCRGCRLYQYAHCFTKQEREVYQATLDEDRREKKNECYQVEGLGPVENGIMVILDYPSKVEDSSKKPFGGGSSYIIKRNARVAGLNADEWYFTYAVKCHDPDGKTNLQSSIYCSGFLSDEIRKYKPKTIITFGPLALQLALGRSDALISQFSTIPQEVTIAGHNTIVFPMQSPGYIKTHDYLQEKYLADFDKLKGFLTGETGVLVDGSDYCIVKTPDEAIRVCKEMVDAVEVGKTIDVDTETSGLSPYKIGARLSVISLACSTKKGYAIMFNHDDCPWTDEERARVNKEGLKPLLRHPWIRRRLHNGKFDDKWFVQFLGYWPRDIVEDTMLTHYSVDENDEHGLKPLALRYTDMGDYDAELTDYLDKQDLPDAPRFDLVPADLLGKYAGKDSVATRKLAIALKKDAAKQDQYVHTLAYTVMPAVSAMLTRLEHYGIAIDLDYVKNVAKPFLETQAKESYAVIMSQPTVRKFIRDGERKAREKIAAGWKDPAPGSKRKKKTLADLPPVDVRQYFEFSLNSPNQMVELLFGEDYYNHDVVGTSEKTGLPSTDKETMTELVVKKSPIAKAIVEHRLDEKLLASYLAPILSQCEEQGNNLLHPNLKIIGTKTGRLASVNPNLQATPNKSGGLVKRFFVSRYGDEGCIVQADFSQLELRIMAAASNDPKMIEAYVNGKDLHMLTCCLIFGITEEQFKELDKSTQKLRRTVAKRVNFGLCLAQGSIVKTNNGDKEIQDVLPDDLLWDGEYWVPHSGVVCTGVKECIRVGDLWATPEHEILSASGWVKADNYWSTDNKGLPYALSDDGRMCIGSGVYRNRVSKGRDGYTPRDTRTLPVYDIVNAGSRNRFQADGHIVHNCYGIGAPGIVSSLAGDGVHISEDEAKTYLDAFFASYPRVRKWLDGIHSGIERDEYARSLFARRRRLEQVRSSLNDVKARALRQGGNHVVQSTGADMTLTSMLLMDQEILLRGGYDSRLIYPTIPTREFPVDREWRKAHLVLQVHDSILVDTPLSLAPAIVDLFNRTMPKVIEQAGLVWGESIYKHLAPMRRVPIEADVEVGPNWRDAYKVKSGKDVPLAMAVANARRAALDKDSRFEWKEDMDKAVIEAFNAGKA